MAVLQQKFTCDSRWQAGFGLGTWFTNSCFYWLTFGIPLYNLNENTLLRYRNKVTNGHFRVYFQRWTVVYVENVQILMKCERIIRQNNKVEKICIMYYNLK